MLTPYLLEIESDGRRYPHVFYAEDAEDAVCSATTYFREQWRRATVVSAAVLDRERFNKAVGRAAGDARRRVEDLLDDPRAVKLAEGSAKGAGGLDRAVAILCGVSKGLVHKVLVARGLRISGGRLVAERDAG